MFNLNEMTNHLMLVASSVDNYCKYLGQDTNEYSSILGYIYRVHQDKIKSLSPQGLALLLIYLKDVDEKDKVDNIISKSKTLEEQFKKMDKLKKSI